ncbi:fibronectin type III domain-containing protein [Paractinoplanes atraurantiacus]|uniref:Serine protease, subtilisin family n=1 Tax=Paractinoplanes atraurantiacus TaxID=1036182 RepID=A0A285GQF2_9ACTN|nr:fibronectin type III domain-containing protein [Actinoplanes atraurantiacus]SNY25870.1 Serine protease, subtilisin family [Actinoplanes atraurantiacus]
MRRRWGTAALAAVSVAALLTAGPAVPAWAEPGEIVNAGAAGTLPGKYIVDLAATVPGAQVTKKAESLVDEHGGDLGFVYESVLRGFSVTATEEQARAIAGDPAVESVAQQVRFERTETQQDAPWHLDRLDEPTWNATAGTGDTRFHHGLSDVPIYIVDTGVNVAHSDFGGRAVNWANVSGAADRDCDGHGTAVAGAAGGTRWGVSKRSPLRSVKVADCGQDIDEDRLLAGLDKIGQLAEPNTPAVVNVSIGGEYSSKLEEAVTRLTRAGLVVITAAGNDNGDSCRTSPSNLSRTNLGVITVGGTNKFDRKHDTSNAGACVTMYAPGTDIEVPDTAQGTRKASGTSLAAPQVAGAAALLLAKNPSLSPAQVRAALLGDALPITPAIDPANPSTSVLLHVPGPDRPGLPSSSNLTDLFHAYGDQGGHWTGGDETMSADLGNGQVAWFFGDTMLGKVNADRSRPSGQPMINNSVVIQEGTTLTKTLHGGTAALPQAYVGAHTKAEPNELGWWPGESRRNGNTLEVFYTHVKRGADGGALSYVTAGRSIARFALPSMALQELVPLNLNTSYKVGWGAALVDGTDGKTYIYGTNRVGEVDSLYVARAPQGSLTNTSAWQYLTGDPTAGGQWSSTETSAAPIMTGIGAGFSVKRLGGDNPRYALVTMDTSEVFSNEVVAYFAKDPAGPFTHQTSLYSAPEPAASKGAWVYNARLHPEQTPSSSDTMVVSYNVNSFTPGACDADVHLCRPRFVSVKLRPPVDGSLLPNAPQNVVATPERVLANKPGDTKVTVSWEPNPSSATGLKYWVYQRNNLDKSSQFTRAHQAVTGRSVQIDVSRNGNYEFRISAENAAGEGPQSLPARSQVLISKPTAAPANLTGTTGDDLTASLSWGAVSAAGFVSYNVYSRNVTAGETAFTPNGTALVQGTTAEVNDLVSENVYEFRVTAKNASGEGPASNTLQLTAKAGSPPTPSGLTATQNPDGTIGLSWKPSSPDAWYWVWTKDITDDTDLTTGFTQSVYPVSNGTSFTAGYLTAGNKYAFYVTAIGKYGTDSPRSNIAQAVARIAPPPAPGNLSAAPNDDGTIRLSWSSSGPDIWYWVYTRNVSDGETTFTKSKYPVSNGTTFTAGYLSNGDNYEFYVTAIGLGDTESAASNKVQAKSEIAPPPAPTKLTASSNDDGTITLSWKSSGPDIWYWVWSKESTATTYTRSTYPVSSGTTFTAGYLTVGKSYDFYVTAIGMSDTVSAPSNVARAKSYVPPPAAPKGLKAKPGNGEAYLSWRSVGDGIWYYVYSRNVTKGGAFTRSQYPVSNGTSFTAGYLTNGDTYEFYVTAIGDFGAESEPSETVQAEPTMPPPPPPAKLTAKPQNDGTIDLTWENQGAGVGYWVYTKDITDNPGTSGGFTKSKYPIMSGGAFTAGYLTNNHEYAFYVVAFNDGGLSGRSDIVKATSHIPPPPAPTVTAKSNKDGTITLNWNKVGADLWYWVYIRDNGTLEWKRIKYPISNGTSFTAGYLSIGTAYAFKVTAIGPGGEGPASSVVTAVSRVPAPTNLTAKYHDNDSIMLDWESVNPDAMFWVYVRDTRTSTWTRQGLPVSGRTWQIVSPLKLGVTYEFFVKQAANGGETLASNTARQIVMAPSDSACASVTSSWMWDPLEDPRKGDFAAIQRRDIKGTACGYRNGSTIRFEMSWDSKGNKLLEGSLRYQLLDCVTGEMEQFEAMYYQSPPSFTQDRRTYTYTINQAHQHRVAVMGGGKLNVKYGPGTFVGHFGNAPDPLHLFNIEPFQAYSDCF